MSLLIDQVDPDGTGAAMGLAAGDSVVAVNDHVVRDPLEWRYLVADEYIAIEVNRGDETLVFEVEKEFDDTLGVHLAGPGFRKCNNRCIFCFIDQNPRKVRKPLRFKDEDFRLSFLYGNYVTLTNTPPEDLDRIVEQRLSPIYVSVHATEPDLRRTLLGNPRAPDILPIMGHLAAGEILMHAQIVLMPGVNDGAHLDRTVDDLAALHPWVGSVCIVPVGLTKHREKLPSLRSHLPEESDALLGWLRRRQREFTEKFGERFVWLSDEFYLTAGARIPSMAHYEGFPQVGNGVGMMRQFIDAFRRGMPRLVRTFEKARAAGEPPLSVDLVTAALPAAFVLDMVARMNREVPGLAIDPHVVLNERYGHGITVSGLLSGGDFADALVRDGANGRAILLPPNVLNDDALFLDDVHIDEFQGKFRAPVIIGSYDLVASIEAVRETIRSGRRPARDLPVVGDAPAETMCAR